MNQQPKKPETARCAGCDRTIPVSVAVKVAGQLYCCPDCAEGRTCDCQ